MFSRLGRASFPRFPSSASGRLRQSRRRNPLGRNFSTSRSSSGSGWSASSRVLGIAAATGGLAMYFGSDHLKVDAESQKTDTTEAWTRHSKTASQTELIRQAHAHNNSSGRRKAILDDEDVLDGDFEMDDDLAKQLADDFRQMKLFSGRANRELAEDIAAKLGVELGDISIKCFADGEIGIQVNENVRGKDVYLIQPTCPPGVNDNLMELLLMISTMRRASVRRITAVIPYYGYARQDRKMQSRVPISAADVAGMLQAMGVDRVVAVDLHCGQIQGFFGPRCPCDNLEGHVVALPYFMDLGLKPETTKVVSPDAGGVHRAKQFRDGLSSYGLDAGLAMIVKQRLQANKVGRMDLVGSVDNCDVIMVDDMIDTAGTLTAAAHELREKGAQRVFAFATHGLFSGPAIDRINKSVLEKVIVCNTVPLSEEGKASDKIVQLNIAGLLSEAILRIHLRKSVSALFCHPSKPGKPQ